MDSSVLMRHQAESSGKLQMHIEEQSLLYTPIATIYSVVVKMELLESGQELLENCLFSLMVTISFILLFILID